jgi:hypothetical protein
VSTIEEIELAVEKLAPSDFARFVAWIDRRRAEVGEIPAAEPLETNGDWFEVYMACPHAFEIPPRKKQFYRPST